MTLSWGIAATGRIARDVGTVIAQHPDHRVAAVSSRSLDRAEVLAHDLGAVAFGDHRSMIEDPSVEAVYVATPHAQHAEVAEIALSAGKAVLCEKPLTHSLAESERLVALSESTGTFLMEAMWTRFNPLVQLLVARLPDLGALRSVHASVGFVAPDDPSSRLWSPELGGGALLDLAVYTVTLARMLLGDPSGLTATGTLRSNGVDEEEALHLTFPSGAQALLDMSLVARLPGTATVIGTHGTALLSPAFYAPTRLDLTLRGREPEVHEITERKQGFIGEIEEVARCLQEGRRDSTISPQAETLATMRVLDQARQLLHA